MAAARPSSSLRVRSFISPLRCCTSNEKPSRTSSIGVGISV
jgi:hypothetical protein